MSSYNGTVIDRTVPYISEWRRNYREKDEQFLARYGRLCNRCNQFVGHSWCDQMRGIEVKFSIGGMATYHLWGYDKDKEIKFNHPAITPDSGYQKLNIEVGYHKDYKLCSKCHKEFMEMVGKFLLERK